MERTDRHLITKGWLTLSVSSLILAGILALLLVVARMPPFHHLVTDPLFFKRCLIVHVELSLFVWFFSFFAFLFTQLPTSKPAPLREMTGLSLSCVGVALLVISAGLPNSKPILSNYLPVIDHPLFNAGLLLFSLGVVITLLQSKLLPGEKDGENHLPEVIHPGLRSAGITLLAAVATIWASWLSTPGYLEAEAYYEVLFWGAGHVLQFANVAAMLSVWLLLTTLFTGEAPVSRKWSSRLFILLTLPTLFAPLVAIQGTTAPFYRRFFTMLMQWGIFPVSLIFLGLTVRCIWRAKRKGSFNGGGMATGLYTSMVLTIVGFLLGAMIRGSNTLVPAHYHASIGAVTVAFMAASYVLFQPLGLKMRKGFCTRWARRQPLLFGVGQTVFALGFALAGAFGMGRKLYGAEQQIRHMGEKIGLIVMGLGGLLAIVGGILFLIIIGKTLLDARSAQKLESPLPLRPLIEKRRIS